MNGIKKYLRFGEIPPNEKSINWWKVSLDEQAAFSWAYENYGYEDAIRHIENPDGVFELGVAVFELDENNEPILTNDNLKKLFNSLKGERKAYIVSGDEVGRGADDEPLLRNIQIIEEKI